jgi:hypothetical protein
MAKKHVYGAERPSNQGLISDWRKKFCLHSVQLVFEAHLV